MMLGLPMSAPGQAPAGGPCIRQFKHTIAARVSAITKASGRSASFQAPPVQEPEQYDREMEPGATGAEFKYTLVALRSNPSKSARRSSKAFSRPAATSGGRTSRSQTYRTFESLEGCALPLMMLGEVEENVPVPRQTAAACNPSHQGTPQEPQQTNPAQPGPVHSTTNQPSNKPRRTHRRCAQEPHRDSKPQALPTHPKHPSDTTAAGPSPIVLHPAPAASLHHQPTLPIHTPTAAFTPTPSTSRAMDEQSSHRSNLKSPLNLTPPTMSATGPEDSLQGPATPAAPSAVMRQHVSKHLDSCAYGLGVHPKVLSERPDLQAALLSIPDPQHVITHVDALMHLLDTPNHHHIIHMIQRHPQLLLTSLPHMQSRAQQVAQLLFQSPTITADVLKVLSTAPALLTTKHEPQQSMLGLSRALWSAVDGRMDMIAILIMKHPNLLSHPLAPKGTVFTEAISTLVDQLGCDEARVVQGCVMLRPELMLRSPGSLAGCCRQLVKQWALQSDQLVELVEAQPQLLLMSPGTVQVTSDRIKGLLLHSRHWAPDVPKLWEKPRALARLLTFDTSRLDRLDYLVTTLRDGGLDWRDALTMSDDDWQDMYPRYLQWWAKQGR